MKLGFSLAGSKPRYPWWPAGAVYAADFVNDRHMRNGALVTRANAFAFARNSPKLAQDSRRVWREFGVDAPALTDRGVLLEPAATNFVPNSAMSGAVPGIVGAGGALPTGWIGAGFSVVEIIATGSEDGLPFIELHLQYQNATGGMDFPRLVCAADVSATLDQYWTASAFYRRIAGAWHPNTDSFLNVAEMGTTSTYPGIARSGEFEQRTRQQVNWVTTRPGTITLEMRLLMFVVAPGEAVDVTARIYAPLLELSQAASSPIIAASGRAEDQLTCHLPAGSLRLTLVKSDGTAQAIDSAETEFRMPPGQYISLTAAPR